MGNRVWYEALALMANATSHHHVFLVASSEEAEPASSDPAPRVELVVEPVLNTYK